MEYLLTGATGFIGSHLTDRLVEDGRQVVALTRDRSNAGHLPEEVDVVEGDITDKETMREAMTGVDAVFHLAAWFQVGPGPWNAQKAERINVTGTRNVLELMDELDVPKGVYVSTVAVYGNTGGEYVDESYRSPNSFPSVYQRSKWRAHYEVAEPMMEAGLPLVVASLGAIYGPGDKNYGGTPRTAFVDYLHGDLPILPSDFVLPFDYVTDAADALVRAMASGTPGEEYIVANEPVNLAYMFELAEEMTGVSAPRTVPGAVFRLLSYATAGVELATKPPEGMESELLRFFDTGGCLVDNTKAVRELGIDHRPVEAGLWEYLAWEIAEQGLGSEIRVEAE
jgi:dihydroflavonol-4-reductase